MKQITKKLALLLIAALLLSTCLLTFAACDDEDDDDDKIEIVETLNGQTPLEVYRAAETMMDNVDNGEVSGVIEISMEIDGDGISASQSMEMDLLMQVNGETMYSKVAGESSGMEAAAMIEEIWLVGGYYYQHENADGEVTKTKTPMTYDEYMARGDDSTDESDFFIDLESGILEGAKFKKEGNTYHVDIKLTGDQVKQLAGDLVGDYDDMVEFDTLNYRMSFDQNGAIKGFRISFSGSATEDGYTMTMEITMRLNVKYNVVDTINPPADASSYELVTE